MALDRTVSVKLKAEVAGYIAGLKAAGTQTASFAKGIETGAVKNTQHLNRVGCALLGVGAVAATGVGMAVRAFASFDASMSKVAAATHESTTNMNLLRDAALEAGARTAFSADEAAGAEEALAKAGVTTADILGGALNGALDLAAAGTLGVSEAAEIAATAMTQFGLSGSDVPHIADLLAAGAGKAQGEVSDLGVALKYVGPVAHQMGVSIEETTGVIAELASNGILADQAGTSMRGMLLSLTAPSAAAADTMKKFGIEVYDAQGNFVGFNGAAASMQAGLGKLDNATRDAAFGQIFGNAQITAARVLYAGGAEEVDNWTDKVNDAGFAQETAAIKMDNLQGDIEKLKGSLSTLFIQGGEGGNEFLRGATQGLEDFVNALGKLSPETDKTILGTTALVGGLALVAGASVKVISGFGTLKTALTGIGRESLLTASSLGKIALQTGGIIAVAVAADQLYQALGKASVPTVEIDKLSDSILHAANAGGLLKDGAELSAEGIALFGTNSRAFGGDARTSKEALDALVGTMADAGGTRVGDKFGRLLGDGSASMAKLTDEAGQMDSALADLVKNGNADVAARQMGLIQDAALEAHYPLDKLRLLFPGYSSAMADVTKANKDAVPPVQKTAEELDKERAAFVQVNPLAKTAAEVTKDFADRQKQAADKVQTHADNLERLLTNLGLLNDTAIDATEAQLNFLDATARTNQEIKDAGTSLDEYNPKGRDNIQWMLDGIKAAEDLAGAVQHKSAETKTDQEATDDANASYARSMVALQKAGEAAGFSADEVAKLIREHGAVKPVVQTIFNTPGLDPAITKTKEYHDWLKDLPKKRQTEIKAKGAAGAAAQVKALRDYIRQLHDKEVNLQINRNIINTERSTGHQQQEGNWGDAWANVSGGNRTGLPRATGGYISGPGGPTSDSIPAWLSNGEYVINAAATAANRTLLDVINRGGMTSGAVASSTPTGYAAGGPVRGSGRALTFQQHVTVANLDELNRKTQNSLRDTITMANLRGM